MLAMWTLDIGLLKDYTESAWSNNNFCEFLDHFSGFTHLFIYLFLQSLLPNVAVSDCSALNKDSQITHYLTPRVKQCINKWK